MSDPNLSAYGHRLAPDLHHTLRSAPPRSTFNWLTTTLGARCVIEVQALEGGTSSAMHLVRLETRGGALFSVVLRRYVLDWLIEEPWAPANEVLVLRLLADSAVAAPRLVASDDGAATGTPTTVMSLLPGCVVWHPRDVDSWLRRLAECLPVINAVPVAAELSEWAPYQPAADLVPPPWTRHPRAWERALEAYAGAVPPSDRVFLHRDFHPGNVLWSAAQVSGIVDWVSTCAGPPEEDVGHCRANLAEHAGMAVADRFLAIWQELTGRSTYDPYFDLTTVVSAVSTTPNPGMDEFVARAAAQLG